MPIIAYMIFNGNCEEAVQYYAEVFGAEKQEIMRFGDSPPEPGFEMPEEMKDRVMHTALSLHGGELMFSDSMPGHDVTFGENISLTIVSDDMDRIKREFAKLSEDGKVEMELQETFWSKAYGALKDKFGISWQFSYDDGTGMQGESS